MRIDLNADVGESFGAYAIGHDPGLMKSITSANVAAGFHAGDPSVLRATVRRAKAHGVAVGAHPSFPDLAGFGRREMVMSPREAEDLVLYQIAAVAGVAQVEGVQLQHVKPHGALYNMASRDVALAGAVARAVAAFSPGLILLGPPGSELLKAGSALGLRVVGEAFADRAYEPDGSLVSRKKLGAIIHDVDAVVERSIRLAKDRTVVAIDGSIVHLRADTICVHGDTPGADELAAKLRQALERAGIEVKPMAAM
ncbi:MAG TPA: 5-oxoprolinase subunit PxpA [Vicinamibacterales bacterium]|nr:5-oxoprolinase subunit PxpA [Vicinamibacterales bacterium]